MKRSTRKFLFLLSLLCFSLLAPAVLLYSFGFRLPTQEGRQISAVGGIYLRTFPRGALIYLNGKVWRRKTPTALRNLPVGTYSLRLTKTGYHDWQKTAAVKENVVTEFRNIILIPQNPREEPVHLFSRGGTISPDRRYLLSWSAKEIVAYDTRSGNKNRLPLPPQLGGSCGAIWNDRATQAALCWKQPQQKRLYVAAFNLYPFRRLATALLPLSTRLVAWHPLHPERWYELERQQLWLRDLTARTRLRITDGIRDIMVFREGLLVIRKGKLEWLDLTGQEQAAPWPYPPEDFRAVDIVAAAPEEIALRDHQGKVLLWHAVEAPEWVEIAPSSVLLRWSPRRTKLLWQTNPYDLWVYNLSDERSPLPRKRPLLLMRRSRPIQAPAWFAGEAHIIYAADDTIRLLEADPRGAAQDLPLASTNSGAPRFIVGEEGETLYYWKKEGDKQALQVLFLRLKRGAPPPPSPTPAV